LTASFGLGVPSEEASTEVKSKSVPRRTAVRADSRHALGKAGDIVGTPDVGEEQSPYWVLSQQWMALG
jgi:hypothetical protein